MMDLRRVQKTGGSTLIISLPKRWAEASGVTNGHTLAIVSGERNTLIIDPNPQDKPLPRSKTLDIDGLEPEHLFRRLIAVYICGYDAIDIRSTEPITAEIRGAIRRFTRIVIGPEITEEDMRTVQMKDLSDSAGFGLRSVVRRIFRITHSMLQDAIAAVKDGLVDTSRDVISRDEEVDRFYWLVCKQYNLMLNRPRFKEENQSMEESLNHLLIGRILERVADHARIISDNNVLLHQGPDPEPIGGEMLEAFIRAGDIALSLLSDAFDAFIRGDPGLANRTIDGLKPFKRIVNEGFESISRTSPMVTVAITRMMSSLERTGMYASDIAEIAINNMEIS